MAFTLPPLPYPPDALEPSIDKMTMEIHHGKHHKAYVDNLNAALEGQAALQAKPIEQLLREISSVPEGIRQKVINNGGGHANHTMFWEIMGPKTGSASRPASWPRRSRRRSPTSPTSRRPSRKTRWAGSAAAGPGWCRPAASCSSRTRPTRTAPS